ncbi:MAG: hypothetical protein IJH04_09150 [Eggerthellaceae bacterium]|nr:hypothetical protein [Eggerthellaceae bacterium]
MSAPLLQLAPSSSRPASMRIGSVSIFVLITMICMAVLAVLVVATAHSSLVLSQRQADAVSELYLNETAAQAFVAELDSVLESGNAAPNANASGQAAISDNDLIAIRDAARKAAGGRVDIVASASNGNISAEFSCSGGRTLKVSLTVNSDGSYSIDKWKMAAVENEEQPMGSLYTGA